MAIFTHHSLYKQSLFNKLFKTFPKKNFLIELENLLADNEECLANIDSNAFDTIYSKYKVSNHYNETEKQSLFALYLDKCLADKLLTADEKNCLDKLQQILRLSDSYVNKKIKDETKLIYENKVKSVLFDNKLTDQEKEELKKMRENLSISDTEAESIYGSEIQRIVQAFVDEIIEKRRMSPEDDEKLTQMLKDLDVTIECSDDGLNKLKLFWKIENGILEPMESDININKNEVLFYKDKIKWYEERSRTTSVSYAGISTRFRICKGVYLKGGNFAPSRETESYMKFIDFGTLYLTNQRIIFMGEHGNKNIPYTRILSHIPYRNGISIEKDSGKSPFFETTEAETLSLYVSRLLNDY